MPKNDFTSEADEGVKKFTIHRLLMPPGKSIYLSQYDLEI